MIQINNYIAEERRKELAWVEEGDSGIRYKNGSKCFVSRTREGRFTRFALPKANGQPL